VEFARYCSDGAPPASAVTIAGGVDVTPETIGLVAGVLFLLIAVVGGGFTVKELQIPRVPMPARVTSGVLGIAFIAFGVYAVLQIRPDADHECRQPRELPSVAEGDRSEAEVRTDLESRGFHNVTVKGVFSPGAPKGVVVDQEPAPSTILCPQDPVTITVTR